MRWWCAADSLWVVRSVVNCPSRSYRERERESIITASWAIQKWLYYSARHAQLFIASSQSNARARLLILNDLLTGPLLLLISLLYICCRIARRGDWRLRIEANGIVVYTYKRSSSSDHSTTMPIHACHFILSSIISFIALVRGPFFALSLLLFSRPPHNKYCVYNKVICVMKQTRGLRDCIYCGGFHLMPPTSPALMKKRLQRGESTFSSSSYYGLIKIIKFIFDVRWYLVVYRRSIIIHIVLNAPFTIFDFYVENAFIYIYKFPRKLTQLYRFILG